MKDKSKADISMVIKSVQRQEFIIMLISMAIVIAIEVIVLWIIK